MKYSLKKPHMYTFEEPDTRANPHNCRIRTPAIMNVTAKDFLEFLNNERMMFGEFVELPFTMWSFSDDDL
jgi:hypothetical protein